MDLETITTMFDKAVFKMVNIRVVTLDVALAECLAHRSNAAEFNARHEALMTCCSADSALEALRFAATEEQFAQIENHSKGLKEFIAGLKDVPQTTESVEKLGPHALTNVLHLRDFAVTPDLASSAAWQSMLAAVRDRQEAECTKVVDSLRNSEQFMLMLQAVKHFAKYGSDNSDSPIDSYAFCKSFFQELPELRKQFMEMKSEQISAVGMEVESLKAA